LEVVEFQKTLHEWNGFIVDWAPMIWRPGNLAQEKLPTKDAKMGEVFSGSPQFFVVLI
jgi:hypothetical protein